MQALNTEASCGPPPVTAVGGHLCISPYHFPTEAEMSLPGSPLCVTNSQFEVQVRSLSLTEPRPLVESSTDKAGIFSFLILRQFPPPTKIHKVGEFPNIENGFRCMAFKRNMNTYYTKHSNRQLRFISLQLHHPRKKGKPLSTLPSSVPGT